MTENTLLEHYQCPICSLTMAGVSTLSCGCNFCYSCISRWYFDCKKNQCPCCRQDFTLYGIGLNKGFDNCIRKVLIDLDPKGEAEQEWEIRRLQSVEVYQQNTQPLDNVTFNTAEPYRNLMNVTWLRPYSSSVSLKRIVTPLTPYDMEVYDEEAEEALALFLQPDVVDDSTATPAASEMSVSSTVEQLLRNFMNNAPLLPNPEVLLTYSCFSDFSVEQQSDNDPSLSVVRQYSDGTMQEMFMQDVRDFMAAVEKNQLSVMQKIAIKHRHFPGIRQQLTYYKEDNSLRTALHFAAHHGNIKMIRFLVEDLKYEHINEVDSAGLTAIEILLLRNTDKTSRSFQEINKLILFLAERSNDWQNPKTGKTIIHHAAVTNNLELIRSLYLHSPMTTSCCAWATCHYYKKNAVLEALSKKVTNIELYRFLMSIKLLPNVQDNTFFPKDYLKSALATDSLPLFKFFVEEYFPDYIHQPFGGTCDDSLMQLAIVRHNIPIAKYLLQKLVIWPNLFNSSGLNDLHLACQHGLLSLVICMVEEFHADIYTLTRVSLLLLLTTSFPLYFDFFLSL